MNLSSHIKELVTKITILNEEINPWDVDETYQKSGKSIILRIHYRNGAYQLWSGIDNVDYTQHRIQRRIYSKRIRKKKKRKRRKRSVGKDRRGQRGRRDITRLRRSECCYYDISNYVNP